MLTRRAFLKGGLIAGGAPMINRGRFQLFASSPKRYSTRTIDLIRESIVIDMLGLITLDWPRLAQWHANPSSFTEADFLKLKQSGITVFHPAVELNRPNPAASARRWIRDWNALIKCKSSYFLRVDSVSDILRAKAEGKIGIIQGMQNSNHFCTQNCVHDFYRLGQRISQLTYNVRNDFGSGCIEARDRGLTGLGVSVIQSMNKAGMAVDLSHAGYKTAMDGITASSKPVLISHSNCRALSPHPRCLPDEVIRKLASHHGVIGITSIRPFVRTSSHVTLNDVLDHYDHVVKITGMEFVGLGSDNDLEGRDRGRSRLRMDVKGLNHTQRVYDLTEALIRRKYTNRHIRLILGENFQRVLSEVWSA